MSRPVDDWRMFIDRKGDFELPAYIYAVINSLMKQSLDMGTLLSDDQAKLRAFKEQTKSIFKRRWLEIGQALEFFEIILPCGCAHSDYCRECGGSRYRLNSALSPEQIREIAIVANDDKAMEKLQAGLEKALREVG